MENSRTSRLVQSLCLTGYVIDSPCSHKTHDRQVKGLKAIGRFRTDFVS